MQPANDNFPAGSSIRFSVEPRLVPAVKAARRLHITEARFAEKLPRLLAQAFPSPCPITGHYDLKAIDLWLDARSGLASSAMPMVAPAIDIISQRLDSLG